MCSIVQPILTLSIQIEHQIPQAKGSASPQLQMPITSLAFIHASDQKAIHHVPTASFLRSINLLQQLTELGKPVYSLDYGFITKDIKGYH